MGAAQMRHGLVTRRAGIPAQRITHMPAKSPRMQKFMGADLARCRAGKATKTHMSCDKLAEMAAKPKGGYAKKRGR